MLGDQAGQKQLGRIMSTAAVLLMQNPGQHGNPGTVAKDAAAPCSQLKHWLGQHETLLWSEQPDGPDRPSATRWPQPLAAAQPRHSAASAALAATCSYLQLPASCPP
ncbi:hypothetical protein HaLaN_06818, partial [Haematococcus lacustris]